MEETLRFLRTFEAWIYLSLGIVGVYFVLRFSRAWQELQGASFGLERESAQVRLNQAASALVLVLSAAVVVFMLVSFVAPTMPGINLPTPTLNLLATATTTLPPGVTPSPGTPGAGDPGMQGDLLAASGCVAGQAELSLPRMGDEVSGIVPVMGTANIPNFGFYKFEIKRPNEANWLTIQAGNTVRVGDKLGDWDTTRLSPGEYQLGLVVVDNEGQALPPCVIQLRVARSPEATIAP
ncbi:MAG: hypothetical protein ACKOC5_08325 [Chloroflexota bacterium]